MHVSKLLTTLGVLACCVGFTTAHAADTPDQAAARVALMQAMAQADATNPLPGTASAPAPAPVVVTAPPAAAPVVAVTATPTGPAPATMPVDSNGDTPEQATARAALMKAMQDANQTNALIVITNAPAAPTPTTAAAEAAAVPTIAKPAPAAVAVNSNGDTPEQAAARAALLKAMQDANQTNVLVVITNVPATPAAVTPVPVVTKPALMAYAPAPAASAPVKAPPAVRRATKVATAMGFAPIVAPPLPISAAQQAALDALDAKYKADQISPVDYFKQREAILNNP
jgi:hypothetical protein